MLPGKTLITTDASLKALKENYVIKFAECLKAYSNVEFINNIDCVLKKFLAGEMNEYESIKRQFSELEDVLATTVCQYENFKDDICKILFDGEDTEIGRKVTIDRIKDRVKYMEWLDRDFCSE